MKDFEHLRRRDLVSQCKSLSFPEWLIPDLFQMIEIKVQVGLSEHDLESQGIWFGAICYEPRWLRGQKSSAGNAPPARGGCEKGKLVLWGLLFIQFLVLKQKGIK